MPKETHITYYLICEHSKARHDLQNKVTDVLLKFQYLDNRELEYCLKMCIYKVRDGKLNERY